MIGKLLCFLGFHRWYYKFYHTEGLTRVCTRDECNVEYRWISNHYIWERGRIKMINKLLEKLGIRKPKIKKYQIRLNYDNGLHIKGVAWGFVRDDMERLTHAVQHGDPEVIIERVWREEDY